MNENRLLAFEGRQIIMGGIIASDPIEKEGKKKFSIGSIVVNNNIKMDGCQVYITTNTTADIRKTDQIVFKGKLTKGFGDYAGYI